MLKIFKYNDFINEERKHFSKYKGSRSESLDHLFTTNDIEELLQKYAPYFLEDKNIDSTFGSSNLMPVYRGVNRKGDIAIINPSAHDRVSRNTENYYTLIIDDTWEGFPKRSKSLICSSSPSRGNEDYERTYRIIPTNPDAVFGIAPKKDIWISFKNGISELNNIFSDFFQYTTNFGGLGNDLNVFNTFLKDSFELEPNESLESLKSKLTVYNFVNTNVAMHEEEEAIERLEEISDNGSLYSIFERVLSIKENPGFKAIKYSESNKKDFTTEKEIWTESECLMIDAEAFDKWMRNKFYTPSVDKHGWSIENGMSTDPRLKSDEERRKRVEDSK